MCPNHYVRTAALKNNVPDGLQDWEILQAPSKTQWAWYIFFTLNVPLITNTM